MTTSSNQQQFTTAKRDFEPSIREGQWAIQQANFLMHMPSMQRLGVDVVASRALEVMHGQYDLLAVAAFHGIQNGGTDASASAIAFFEWAMGTIAAEALDCSEIVEQKVLTPPLIELIEKGGNPQDIVLQTIWAHALLQKLEGKMLPIKTFCISVYPSLFRGDGRLAVRATTLRQ